MVGRVWCAHPEKNRPLTPPCPLPPRPALSPSHALSHPAVFQFNTLTKAFGDSSAVIVCTGATDRMNPLGPFNVDYEGTLNLLALAKQKGVKKFILVTSIGTDEFFNLLNLFWGVLFWKKRAEEALQRSGIEYTIGE
jgi:uncharacterized protein YbjT (DUF2867 family)